MDNDKYFNLFATCIPVKGAKNYVICDLDRSKVQFIPEDLYLILTQYRDFKLKDILENFDINDSVIILDYFKFLVDLELGFFTNTPQNFPPLEEKFCEPELINNSILEINSKSNVDYIITFLNQISELGCKYLEIRIFDKIDILLLLNSLIDFSKSSIQNITIHTIFDYSEISIFKSIFELEPRISSIYLYTENDLCDYNFTEINDCNIEIIQSKLSNLNCGVISQTYFSCKISTYLEALTRNTCLNRKISLDVHGNLKNCPSMNLNFGSIINTSIKELINNNDFNKFWKINKDEIETCKICEFRYICTDCRAYLTNPNDQYSKPLKCGYDPIKGESFNWIDSEMNKLTFHNYQLKN